MGKQTNVSHFTNARPHLTNHLDVHLFEMKTFALKQ